MRGILLLLLTILFENIDTTAMHFQAFDRISKNGEPILMLDLNNGPIDTLDRLQFIRLSFDYIPIRSFQEQVNLLKPEEAQPAVIDEIQFRFSNDEFQPQDQRYDIRFRPTNPLDRKKTKELETKATTAVTNAAANVEKLTKNKETRNKLHNDIKKIHANVTKIYTDLKHLKDKLNGGKTDAALTIVDGDLEALTSALEN